MVYENPCFLPADLDMYDIQKNVGSLLNWKNINCIKKNISSKGNIVKSETRQRNSDTKQQNLDKISYLVKTYWYKQEGYNLSIPNKKEREKMKNKYFSESGMLKKYKNKIKGLGLDYKEIINELDSFSNNFDMPKN